MSIPALPFAMGKLWRLYIICSLLLQEWVQNQGGGEFLRNPIAWGGGIGTLPLF